MKRNLDPASLPCSPLDEVDGVLYLPRMIGKIRLHAAGKLWEELHQNLGSGSDGWCCGFLHIDYSALKARVLQGGSDEEILAWCQEHGRALNEADKVVWKHFVTKLGWNDMISPALTKRKAESGLTDREDITTIAHYIDVDEGRRP